VATKSFHVSNCVVAPPQFTPSLFISLLSLLSSSSNNDFEWQLVSRTGQVTSNFDNNVYNQLAEGGINSTLGQVKNCGSSTSALRIITLKVIELLNDSRAAGEMCLGSGNQDKLNDETRLCLQKWTAGKAILNEIVSVVKELHDGLGFATFFLSIGRQLEPHQFNLIFPLPSDTPLRTAEDLFSDSCGRGSLATALSALPLFSCHSESQENVTKLVYHCLLKIEENFRSCYSATALTSLEDEVFLHQLFWFGVKLEDAIEIENSFQAKGGSICTSESNKDDHSLDSRESSLCSSSTSNDEESSIDEDYGDESPTDEDDGFASVSSSKSYEADYPLETFSSEDSQDISFLSPCRTPRKEIKQKPKVGIVNQVVRTISTSGDNPVNPMEEDAINQAASSFILSGFDDMTVTSAPRTPLPATQNENSASVPELDDGRTSESEEVSVYEDSDMLSNTVAPATVAGAVSLFMCNVLAFGSRSHSKNITPNHGWKALSAVAHLLQGDRETIAITAAGSANAQMISRTLTIKDFLSAAGPFCHIEEMTDERDQCEVIAELCEQLTFYCRQQLLPQAFDGVFNLVLLLLLRYDACHDVQQCRATLIAAGIVTGHLSSRISELLALSEAPCDVNDIYSLYSAKMNA